MQKSVCRFARLFVGYKRKVLVTGGSVSSPFLPQWPGSAWQSIFSQLRTSPSLAGGAPQTTNGLGENQTATDTKQWGSPSSVESAAIKTDSSTGILTVSHSVSWVIVVGPRVMSELVVSALVCQVTLS